MQPREKLIIKILYDKADALTTDDLSILTNSSKRTIKSDIKCINEKLNRYGVSVHTKSSVGIWLDATTDGARYLKDNILLDTGIPFYSPENRKYWLAKQLLESKDFLTIQQLADELYVSSATISKELDELDGLLFSFDLKLRRELRQGLKVIGNEKEKRIAKAEIIKHISATEAYQNSPHQLSSFFTDIDFVLIGNLLEKTEEYYQINFPDITLKGLMIHTAIMISRMNEGSWVELPKEEFKRIQKHENWKISEYYMKLLEQSYLIKIPKEECAYFTIHLMGINFKTKNELSSVTLDDLMEIDEKLLNTMIIITEEISLIFHEKFYLENEFIIVLFYHVMSLISRKKSGITFQNPMLDEIKTTYTYAFEIASVFLAKLSNKYQLEIVDEDEIGYVALHIEASLERLRKQGKVHQDIIIVCASGLSSSQLLNARFESEFPYLTVKNVMNERDFYAKMTELEYDFVVSTIPLHEDVKRQVVISPLLTKKDIVKVGSYYEKKIIKTDGVFLFDTVADLFNDNISFLQEDIETMDEAITFLGTEMMNQGFVDEGFIDSVLERESLASTAIGSLIALPHQYNGTSLKQGIGFLTTKKPIDWKGENVQIIFLLAFDIVQQRNFKEFYKEIAALLDNPVKIAQIIRTKSMTEIKDILM